jgi:HAD superfamily hydrolase (TIGR01509 family)
MITNLIFDFDGLILDTETPQFEAWQALYRQYGHEFTIEQWGLIVGGTAATTFDPAEHLSTLVGGSPDAATLNRLADMDSNARILTASPLPGVIALLEALPRLKVRAVVASSSPHAWVDGHLARLGLNHHFETTLCREDVTVTKPAPDLFLAALRFLAAAPETALVLEDSPNGILAAQRAGLRVVAVPNPTTAPLGVSHANLVLNSLADLAPEDLLAKF